MSNLLKMLNRLQLISSLERFSHCLFYSHQTFPTKLICIPVFSSILSSLSKSIHGKLVLLFPLLLEQSAWNKDPDNSCFCPEELLSTDTFCLFLLEPLSLNVDLVFTLFPVDEQKEGKVQFLEDKPLFSDVAHEFCTCRRCRTWLDEGRVMCCYLDFVFSKVKIVLGQN